MLNELLHFLVIVCSKSFEGETAIFIYVIEN